MCVKCTNSEMSSQFPITLCYSQTIIAPLPLRSVLSHVSASARIRTTRIISFSLFSLVYSADADDIDMVQTAAVIEICM